MRKLLALVAAFAFFSLNVWAQRTLTGKVTDENGAPLSNVSVVVKGSSTGTVTKTDGTFSLSVPAGARELEISSLGFAAQTIAIGSGSNYNVSLVSSTKDLNEVVVTGITRVRRSQFAGAASKIDARQIVDRPVGSFDQILQGRAPGVLSLTGSGQPGTASTLIIRGSGSVQGGSQPLYIVDGIPVEAGVFQALNPNDFASIDVLRDAATAALYGSRGSAGVVVVTTKRGTGGKMKLSYSGQMGIKSKPDFAFRPMTTPELLKAQEQYGSIVGGATNNNSLLTGWYLSKNNPRYATLNATQQAAADRALDSISQIQTNWEDYFFRPGNFSNHQITLSGGTGKTRIFSSLGLYNEEGTTDRTDMKRVTFRNNVDYADDKFSLSVSSNLGYVKRNFQQTTQTNGVANPFLATNIALPYKKVFNPDGTYAAGAGFPDLGATQLDLTYWDENYNDQIKATLGFTATYNLTENISVALTSGIDFRETQNTNYGSQLAFSRRISSSITTRAGFQSESISRFLTSNVRPSVTFKKIFAERHDFEFSAIGEYIQENSKAFNLTGFGIDPRTPNTPAAIQVGNAANQLFIQAGGSKFRTAIASGLAVARYTFDGKYTLTGSIRRDGSSKLSEKNRWQNFYAVGAIWDMTKESFMESIRAINVMRIKLSYGSAGNHNNFPSNYLYQARFSTGNYSGLNTQLANYPGNPDARWETIYTTNLGIDFEIVNRRIYGDINLYNRITKDLFISRRLGPTVGGGGWQIDVNAGELGNKGVEWNLNFDVVRNRNLTWTLFTNGSYNKNELLSLGGEEPYESGTSFLKEGLPLGSHYEVKWGGVDAATGQPLYYDLDGKLTTTYAASNSVTDFGTWEAPWKGGFGTSLRYKGFDFSVLFSWQEGATKVDNLEFFVENPVGFLGTGQFNQSADLKFWTKPGDVVNTPSPLYGVNFSSKLIHDASFLRFRDVTLSYTLPESTTAKMKFISNVKFYVQGTNLFIWTKWRGMDPEAGAVNINLSEFPNPRAFTGGLNITF